MKNRLYPSILLPLFVALTCAGYIWLRIGHIQSIRQPREFYDTLEFMEIASRPLTSVSFWAAIKPPVTPLLFKWTGADPLRVMPAQLWISILAWGILALALASVVRNRWLKPLSFVLVLAFSLVQNVILWDSLVLSESLSFSLLALFFAAGLRLADEWTTPRFVLLTVSALLLANIRDTFAYFLLMLGAALLPLLVFPGRRWRILLVSGLFAALFLQVAAVSTSTRRWQVPFLMTVGIRILPSPEYLAYFEARGMPVNDALLERSGKPIQADEIAMMNDPELAEFREWVAVNGRREYVRFLWFFKADTLQNPIRDMDWTLNPDVYYYAATGFRPIVEDARLNELLYPFRFGLAASFLTILLAAGCLYPALQTRDPRWIVPLGMTLLAYPQAVLVWNADAGEVARHSIAHVVMLRLGFWFIILFALDFMAANFKFNRLSGIWRGRLFSTAETTELTGKNF